MKLLFNLKYKDDLIHCIKNCIFCLCNNYLVNTHRSILIDIINEFNKDEKEEYVMEIFKYIDPKVNDFKSLISFLDEKFSFFAVFLKNLYFIKNQIYLLTVCIHFHQIN